MQVQIFWVWAFIGSGYPKFKPSICVATMKCYKKVSNTFQVKFETVSTVLLFREYTLPKYQMSTLFPPCLSHKNILFNTLYRLHQWRALAKFIQHHHITKESCKSNVNHKAQFCSETHFFPQSQMKGILKTEPDPPILNVNFCVESILV